MNTEQIQYVSNTQGKPTAVIVPIELWQEIIANKSKNNIKDLLLSMPNVGEDEDFARHQDLGRECKELLDFVEKHRVKVDCISIPNRDERNAR